MTLCFGLFRTSKVKGTQSGRLEAGRSGGRGRRCGSPTTYLSLTDVCLVNEKKGSQEYQENNILGVNFLKPLKITSDLLK